MAATMRRLCPLAVLLCCMPLGLPSVEAQAGGDSRMIIENVDRYRVMEPCCEGVRVVLKALGDEYSPAYLQGVSGAAFRISGICPCAPTCATSGMDAKGLLKLLGYSYTECYLGDSADDPQLKPNMAALIPKIKASVRAGRPVLVWHAFTNAEWDVVAGFDDAKGVFLGRGSYAGLDGYAQARQDRAQSAIEICPALGALFVGEKTGKYNSRAAEIAALKEAVRHAHDRTGADKLGGEKWVMLEGLMAYNRWADKFKDPAARRDSGDSYCYDVYRSTHRAAGRFLREIAPHFPQAAEALTDAARDFTAEAAALDQAESLLAWNAPEQDAERNAKLWPLLTRARNYYAAGIAHIERALPLL